MLIIRHNNNRLYFYGSDKTHAYYCSDGYTERRAKLHYRHERTWDDHIGNTPCGYYFTAIWPDHSTQRVYLSDVTC